MDANPFMAGFYDGKPTYWFDVQSRLNRVKDFNLDQCEAALGITDLQKTVRLAVERRLRKLQKV